MPFLQRPVEESRATAEIQRRRKASGIHLEKRTWNQNWPRKEGEAAVRSDRLLGVPGRARVDPKWSLWFENLVLLGETGGDFSCLDIPSFAGPYYILLLRHPAETRARRVSFTHSLSHSSSVTCWAGVGKLRQSESIRGFLSPHSSRTVKSESAQWFKVPALNPNARLWSLNAAFTERNQGLLEKWLIWVRCRKRTRRALNMWYHAGRRQSKTRSHHKDSGINLKALPVPQMGATWHQ